MSVAAASQAQVLLYYFPCRWFVAGGHPVVSCSSVAKLRSFAFTIFLVCLACRQSPRCQLQQRPKLSPSPYFPAKYQLTWLFFLQRFSHIVHVLPAIVLYACRLPVSFPNLEITSTFCCRELKAENWSDTMPQQQLQREYMPPAWYFCAALQSSLGAPWQEQGRGNRSASSRAHALDRRMHNAFPHYIITTFLCSPSVVSIPIVKRQKSGHS